MDIKAMSVDVRRSPAHHPSSSSSLMHNQPELLSIFNVGQLEDFGL